MADDRVKVAVHFDDIDQLEVIALVEALAEDEELEVFDGVVEAWIPGPALGELDRGKLLYQRLVTSEELSPYPSMLEAVVRGMPLTTGVERVRGMGGTLSPELVDLATAKPGTYRLKLAGAMRDSWREVLHEANTKIMCFHPPDIYVMELDEIGARRLATCSWVLAAWAQDTNATVSPDLVEAVRASEGRGPGRERAIIDVLLHQDDARDATRRDLEVLGWAEILDDAELLIRVRIPLDLDHLEAIAAFPSVKAIRSFAPSTLCDRARVLIGVGKINGGRPLPWDGSGERVLLLDSGIDETHPDILEQIEHQSALDGAVPHDHRGHGTHVAGIILGTGQASDREIKGIAPGARLVSVGITDEAGALKLPADLGRVLQQALAHDARVVNASWEVAPDGRYEQGALTVDAFVRANPQVLVVVAAGNSGRALDGKLAYYTVGSPANAKNVLTVGASATDRSEIHKTWGEHSLSRFPEPPVRDLPMSGNPQYLAALSSRGPTEFDSVKPDVVAPGTWILAPRAARTPEAPSWNAPRAREDRYVFMGGTSMAAPVVSGAALLLRHYLRVAYDLREPSAALLKAMLISAAVPLPPTPGSHAEFGYPDFDQGFGLVDLSSLLPHDEASPKRGLRWVDVPNDSPQALRSRASPGSGQKSVGRYEFDVVPGATECLRIVLAWLDHPGNGVQNNLKLMVRDPNGERLLGNGGHHFVNHPLRPTELAFDRRNTVEIVRVDGPLEGRWRVSVVAENTPFPPQGYALVVCGELDGLLEPG